MADNTIMATMAYTAERQALAIIEEFGPEERGQRLATYLTVPHPNAVQDNVRHSALQSEIIAGLAEIVREQAGRIAALEDAHKPDEHDTKEGAA